MDMRNRLYFDEFGQILLPVPPVEEQNAIVNFLNSKIFEIDTFISNKQKMIEMLNEKKKAIINQAVMKGIRLKVKLKPSGIKWFGDIPEHWKTIKLKFIALNIFGGSTPDSDNSRYWEGDIVWITPEDISQNQFLNDSRRKISIEGYKNCGAKIARIGSLILTTRAPIGNVSIALVPLCTNQGCKSIELKSVVNNEYYFFLLQIIQIILDRLGQGTTFKELSLYSLKNLYLPVPEMNEQVEIVNYIKSELEQVRSAITIIEKEIQIIQEYKTTLISEAVTGKICVNSCN